MLDDCIKIKDILKSYIHTHTHTHTHTHQTFHFFLLLVIQTSNIYQTKSFSIYYIIIQCCKISVPSCPSLSKTANKSGFVLGICLTNFFYVGPLKEDIFSGHHLSPVFQSSLHITFTSLCLCVGASRFSCLLLCVGPSVL